MEIDLIVVPYDSGLRADRMGAGPLHLLQSGLASQLEAAGHRATIHWVELPPGFRATEIAATFELAASVARRVSATIEAGAFPLILSGNCAPAALGSVGGLHGRSNVFWFDAHGDFNTPDTTRSGFLDGMALATVTGRCWAGLALAIPGFAPIAEGDVTTIGVRDLDADEAAALETSAVRRIGVHTMRTDLPHAVAGTDAIRKPAYLHLDLDVLDPGEGRMNQFAVPEGLDFAELQWALTTIADGARIKAAALTAFDPAIDASGQAARAAIRVGLAVIDAVAHPPQSQSTAS